MITAIKDKPPVFPCYFLTRGIIKTWMYFANDKRPFLLDNFTHWSPDAPAAPMDIPDTMLAQLEREAAPHPQKESTATLKPGYSPLSEPGYTEDCRCSGVHVFAAPEGRPGEELCHICGEPANKPGQWFCSASHKSPKGETPRTEAVAKKYQMDYGTELAVPSDFARQLERELTEAKAECEQLRDNLIKHNGIIGQQFDELCALQAKHATFLQDLSIAVRDNEELRAQLALAQTAPASADTARLDWLEKNSSTSRFFLVGPGAPNPCPVYHSRSSYVLSDMIEVSKGEPPSIRAAIDAAMRPSPTPQNP